VPANSQLTQVNFYNVHKTVIVVVVVVVVLVLVLVLVVVIVVCNIFPYPHKTSPHIYFGLKLSKAEPGPAKQNL